MGKKLTELALEKVKAGKADRWLIDGEADRGAGQLMLRVTPANSRRWYFRYMTAGKRVTMPIGYHGGEGGMSLTEARAKVEEYRALRRDPDKADIAAYLTRKAEAARHDEEIKRLAAEREERLRDAASMYSLKVLIKVYTDYLKAKGRQAAKDADNLLQNHVVGIHPLLVAKPAADVTANEIAYVIRCVKEKGKERTAGKVRSYLAAAYALALRAPTDPDAPAAALGFELRANPAAAVKAVTGIKERHRVLDEIELRAYMSALDTMTKIPQLHRDALRLNLLLAGQRAAQLVRLRLADINLLGGSLTLFDPKGKRKEPRRHVIHLAPKARKLVAELAARAESLSTDSHKVEYLLTGEGKVPLRMETMSDATHRISVALVKGKAIREPFQMRDIRRTVETMLAAMGISKNLRAHLLSHGLGGVQDKHYDRYAYAVEKENALIAWERKLDTISTGEEVSNVRQIGRARRAKR